MQKGSYIHPILLQRARELRQPQTKAEQKVWAAVRNQQLGFKLRRQHPIHRFIVDFYCAEAKLVIEIDGDSHNEPDQQEYDARRTEVLQLLGCHVLRFTNEDVWQRLTGVLEAIVTICEERVGKVSPPETPISLHAAYIISK